MARVTSVQGKPAEYEAPNSLVRVVVVREEEVTPMLRSRGGKGVYKMKGSEGHAEWTAGFSPRDEGKHGVFRELWTHHLVLLVWDMGGCEVLRLEIWAGVGS